MEARITPIPIEDFSPEWEEILRKLPGEALKGEHAPVNVLGVIAKSPKIFGPWLEYWVDSKLALKLSLRVQELIILRIAFLRKSDYVWGHHTLVAKEAGISEAEIQKITQPPKGNWEELEEAFLAGAEELLEGSDLSDATWNVIKKHCSDREIMDYMTVVTQYFFFTTVNKTFRIPLEEGLQGLP